MIPARFIKPIPCLSSLVFFVLFLSNTYAQQNNPLINSGELISQGNQLHEDKKYKEAIELYKQISRSDTNYSDALYELSYSHYADSQMQAAHNYALEGLRLFPDDYTKFALLDGNILDDMKRTDDALALYDEALKRNPHSAILYFNKGLTLLKIDKNEEAKKNLEQSLLINPYYSSSHYLLGALLYDEGNLVASMLALKTYLLVAPSGKYSNKALQKLNSIAKVTDEVLENVKKYKPRKEDNFDLQQQILLSKISYDKKYKLEADLEDYIVRQIQVVDEKLEYNRNDKGFCMQYYVPFYIKTFKEGQFEPMIFTLFSGLDLKPVQSWNNRNKKKAESYATTAVTYLNEIKNSRVLNATERKDAPLWYLFDDGKFVARGPYKRSGDKVVLTGPWEFFHDIGNVSAKGEFNEKEKKTGEWVYFYKNGQLKQKTNLKEDIEEGLSEGWFDNGNKWFTENYVDGKLEGLNNIYYYNGLLKSSVNYKAGQKEGIQKNYSSSGSLTGTQNYVNDKKDGEGITYFSNGKIQDQLNYKDDKATGTYKSFYNSGAQEQVGEFADNMRQGLWTTYYESGTIKEKTTYKDNEITGEFTEYYEDGKLSRKGNYTKKKIDGKLESYDDDGILYTDATYEKGRLREINFYDKKGNNISGTTTRRGAADITFFTPAGIKTSQGYFNKEGLKEGKFTEYFPSGKISGEANYKEGQEEGANVDYYNNGQKKLENTYTDGEENGYVKGYFYNGKLSYEGWVIEGSKQQHIIYYNNISDIIQKTHYLDNELDGYTEYFYPGNIKDYEYRYHHGWLEEINQYDSTGKTISSNVLKKGAGTLLYKHYNGKTAATGTYDHYMLTGAYKIFFFDGTVSSAFYYVNDERDSTYKDYFYGGVLRTEGKYKNGDKTGGWKYYFESGKLKEEAIFKDGKLEGIDKTYNEDGTTDKIINYKNNEWHGEYRMFGDNNQLALILNYKEGILQSYSYEDKAGKLVPAIQMKGASGKVVAYYKNGIKSAEMDFLDNDVQGVRKFYFTTGKIYIDGTREFGYDNGVKKVYYPTGNIMKEENWILGNFHGKRKIYYPNGKTEKEENYYNDDLHGTCRYFDMQGKLKQTRVYFYGNLLSVN
ncbi:MAG: tetratricopeptide repeat protein [Chitinophagaceae bacterium]|nr:tetratricopeptide repeat protein [Chitinophagaceae bacterium]